MNGEHLSENQLKIDKRFCDERHENLMVRVKATETENRCIKGQLSSMKNYVIATLTTTILSLLGVILLWLSNSH